MEKFEVKDENCQSSQVANSNQESIENVAIY